MILDLACEVAIVEPHVAVAVSFKDTIVGFDGGFSAYESRALQLVAEYLVMALPVRYPVMLLVEVALIVKGTFESRYDFL
jgi:hypothetical protein